MSQFSLLKRAIMDDNIPKLRELIDADETILLTQDDDGWSSLRIAASANKPNAVQVLIKYGVELNENAVNMSGTPLLVACMNNFLQIAKLLIEAGANPNIISIIGTPLHAAIHQNHPEIVKLLIAAPEIDFNARSSGGDTPLHLAATKNLPEISNLLIEAGADIESQNQRDTPLHKAVMLNSLETVKLLAKAGANLKAKGLMGTPLHISQSVAIAKVLLDAGADIEAVRADNCTPLHGAVHTGRVEVVEFLVGAGASLLAKNKHDKMPLDLVQNNIPLKVFLEKTMVFDKILLTKDAGERTKLKDNLEGINDKQMHILGERFGLHCKMVVQSSGEENYITPLLQLYSDVSDYVTGTTIVEFFKNVGKGGEVPSLQYLAAEVLLAQKEGLNEHWHNDMPSSLKRCCKEFTCLGIVIPPENEAHE
jgi:ankyrin repeat protein